MVQVRALAAATIWVVASAAGPELRAQDASSAQPGAAAPGQTANEQKSAAAIDGEKLFAGVCGFCHAQGGRKASKGPKLAGSKRSDDFIIDRIKHGKPGRMPAFGGSFSDEQIQQILQYIRSLEP